MDRNNYARSARANGRGGADANADARRGWKGSWREGRRGKEIEKRLAGNTTRNSDTRCTEKRKKKATKIQKGRSQISQFI